MFRRTSAHAFFEQQFVLRKTLPGFLDHVAEWEALSAERHFEDNRPAVEAFGEHPRQTIEILKADPGHEGRGLFVFAHGGFWRAMEREQSRFMAAPFLKRGYDGSGHGEERDWLSQADYNRIVDIAQNTYNYDPGGQPGDGLQEDEKYLLRLDWNINDDHNAAVIYNYYDGYQLRDSDGDQDEFEFANHFYKKGAENEQFTLKLNSQWTDSFSTEVF